MNCRSGTPTTWNTVSKVCGRRECLNSSTAKVCKWRERSARRWTSRVWLSSPVVLKAVGRRSPIDCRSALRPSRLYRMASTPPERTLQSWCPAEQDRFPAARCCAPSFIMHLGQRASIAERACRADRCADAAVLKHLRVLEDSGIVHSKRWSASLPIAFDRTRFGRQGAVSSSGRRR